MKSSRKRVGWAWSRLYLANSEALSAAEENDQYRGVGQTIQKAENRVGERQKAEGQYRLVLARCENGRGRDADTEHKAVRSIGRFEEWSRDFS